MPDAFYNTLFERNANYCGKSDPVTFENASKGQAPKAFWLGCSDSRVSEAQILETASGEVFVHRNIANVFSSHDPSATAALAYAIQHLNVTHVIIVGHSSCGGCAAALSSATSRSPPPACPGPPDFGDEAIAKWIAPIRSLAVGILRKAAGGRGPTTPEEQAELVATVVEANVCAQVSNVAQCEIVRKAWKQGKKVWVHGWVYDLASGRLKDLEISEGPQVVV